MNRTVTHFAHHLLSMILMRRASLVSRFEGSISFSEHCPIMDLQTPSRLLKHLLCLARLHALRAAQRRLAQRLIHAQHHVDVGRGRQAIHGQPDAHALGRAVRTPILDERLLADETEGRGQRSATRGRGRKGRGGGQGEDGEDGG